MPFEQLASLAIVLLVPLGLLDHAIWKRWSFKEPTHPNADLAVPIAVGAAGLAIVALTQVPRHEAQNRADQLRRTEKAVELLANDDY